MHGDTCTGSPAHAHTHTHTPTHADLCREQLGSVCSASGSFALRSVSHNDPCTSLCLHCAQLKQRSFPSPSPFKCALRPAFVRTCAKTQEKAWLQVTLAKGKKKKWTQGPSSLRNQLEFEKCTWYTASWVSFSFLFFILCGKFLMFLHSNQGQRDISQVLFHVRDKSSQNRGLLLERSW